MKVGIAVPDRYLCDYERVENYICLDIDVKTSFRGM